MLAQQPQTDAQRRQQLLASLLGVDPQALPIQAPQPAAGPPPAAPQVFPQPPSPSGTAAPTNQPQPVKPLAASTPGYGTPSTDLEQAYLQAHPMAGGTAPTPYVPETGKHALLRGIFAGMSEFGRPGEGQRQNELWTEDQQAKEQESRNWPLQREKNIQTGMAAQQQQEHTAAETESLKAGTESAKRNYPTLQQMQGKWLEDAGNDPVKRAQAVDMIARLETAGRAPQALDPFRLFVEQFTAAHPGQIPTFEDWQAEQVKGAKQGTLKPEIIAQVGPEPDPRTYPLGEKDPQYQAAALKWGGDYQTKLEAETASTAAARGQAFGEWRPMQVLNPATGQVQIQYAKDAIAEGAAPAQLGMQLMSKESQIGDIEFASGQAREAIGNLEPLDAGSIATLTMAMRQTDPTIYKQEIDSLLGSQTLTPHQRAFVTWIGQINERAMSLRSIAGMGQAGEDLRAAIQATLPGLKDGNKDLMLQKLDAFDNQVRILKGGIPTVKHPATPTNNLPKGTYVWDDKGNRQQADGTAPLPQGWSLTKPAGK